MVNYCRVFGCTNRSDREQHLEFYRLPKVITNQGEECQQLSEERRRTWLQKLNQDLRGKNLNNIRICSAHFVSGKRTDLYRKNDPDWAPSVRMTGTGKSRYERHSNRNQKIPKDVSAGTDDPETLIKEIMTQQSQEAKQTDREPEEKLEIKALFQTKRIPANVLCGKRSDLNQNNDPDWVPSVRMTGHQRSPEETGKSRYKRRSYRNQRMPKDVCGTDDPEPLIKEIMTQQSQEAKQTDREPEEKLEIIALFQTKRIPANVLCGESTDGLKLQDHLQIKKEEEELWESLEQKQETDITAVTVKSEDEEEEAQCSLLHWRQSEENIKGEPATCSSAKLMKVEPNGDISEGPEAANTWTQPDSDGEETDCSDTEDSEDWREHMDNRKKSFGCDLCGKRFSDRAHLKNHTRIHKEKPFECDLCSLKFNQKLSFSAHMSNHTREKPFGCDVCGKQFHNRTALKVHMRIHTGEKPFVCDFCGKRFSEKTNLNNHVRIHTGEKPFGCNVCSQKFIQQASLSAHMRIHTGEKSFGCDVCGKRFSTRTNLNIHMRIHTGEKPFGCDVCGKGFRRKCELDRHMIIHTIE